MFLNRNFYPRKLSSKPPHVHIFLFAPNPLEEVLLFLGAWEQRFTLLKNAGDAENVKDVGGKKNCMGRKNGTAEVTQHIGGFATKHKKLVHPSPSQTTKKAWFQRSGRAEALALSYPMQHKQPSLRTVMMMSMSTGRMKWLQNLPLHTSYLTPFVPREGCHPREVARVPVRPKLSHPGGGMKGLWDKTQLSEGLGTNFG